MQEFDGSTRPRWDLRTRKFRRSAGAGAIIYKVDESKQAITQCLCATLSFMHCIVQNLTALADADNRCSI